MKTPIPTERAVQRAILRDTARQFPKVLLHHSPNGAHLKGDAGSLLGDGMRPGFCDLIAIWDGGVGFLEVKRPHGPRGGGGGIVSPEQEAMMRLLVGMGHNVAIVRSVAEAHSFLRHWGAPCVERLVA